LFGGGEVVGEDAGAAQSGEAAAERHAEARFAVPGAREQADVVERGADAVVAAAAAEGDLELAREGRAERSAQKVPGDGFGVRRAVERLQRGCARVRAGGDVADGVAARLARGESRVGERGQRRARVVELDEVELHVLAGGDVAAAGRVLLRDVGERP